MQDHVEQETFANSNKMLAHSHKALHIFVICWVFSLFLSLDSKSTDGRDQVSTIISNLQGAFYNVGSPP